MSPLPEPGSLSRIERSTFDYGDLEAAMAYADDRIRHARRAMEELRRSRTEAG
jgi:hypothetical protein